MKAVRSSETSVNSYQLIWRHIPEDSLHSDCCEKMYYFLFPVISFCFKWWDRWFTTWKRSGTNQSWPNGGIIPALAWSDWEIPRKTSVRIAGAPDEIRTEHLPNTSLKRNRHTNLVSVRKSILTDFDKILYWRFIKSCIAMTDNIRVYFRKRLNGTGRRGSEC
jgi:hypothetical protein